MSITTRSRRSLPLKVLGFVGLAAAGAATGYVLANFDLLGALPWGDAIALTMAAAMGVMAVASAVSLTLRSGAVPKGCGTFQVVVLVLACVLFLAPMYGDRVASPNLVFAAVVMLLALQIIANLMLWRRADEMLRRVMAETSAMAFWASQAALFLYAAAERLGLVGSISAWGMIGVMMGVYLVASAIAAARRGLT